MRRTKNIPIYSFDYERLNKKQRTASTNEELFTMHSKLLRYHIELIKGYARPDIKIIMGAYKNIVNPDNIRKYINFSGIETLTLLLQGKLNTIR